MKVMFRALSPLPSVFSANLYLFYLAFFSLYKSLIKTRRDGPFICCMRFLVIQVDLNELFCSVLFIGVK